MTTFSKLFTFALFLFSNVLVHAQVYGWGYRAGSDTWDSAFSSHLGNDNNLVVTGMFQNTGDFGTLTIYGWDYQDGFVAKYDNLGNAIWANAINGTSGQVWGQDVTTDSNNNVYVTGYFQSNAIYFTPTDSIEITAGSSRDVFLVKYNSSGVYQWAVTGEGSGLATGRTVTCDSQDNVIIGGSYNTTITFNGTTSPSSNTGIYLAKFDDAGSVLWVKGGTSSSSCWIADLDTDANDNIYATGKISQPVTFGSTTVNNNLGDDMLIAKFDASGNIVWSEVIGKPLSASTTSNNYDSGNAIVVDGSGNVFVAGSLLDTVYISGGAVTLQSAAVMKYNNSGSQQWLNTYGSNELDVINGIALDDNGDPYVIGNYSETFSVGAFTLPVQSGNTRAFMAKFDKTSGAPLWATEHGTSTSGSDNTGMSLQIEPTSGEILSVGDFKNVFNFGVNSITSIGSWDIYLVLSNDIADIEDQVSADISMYPNPTQDHLTITMPIEEYGNGTISICRLNGQVVMEETLLSETANIDLSDLTSGNYLVMVKTNDAVFKKLITKF